jgi:hypothetical protein
MKMSFPGIGHAAPAADKSPSKQSFVWAPVGPGGAPEGPDVTSSVTVAARQLARLARLRETDPERFETAVEAVVAELRQRANERTDAEGEALAELAGGFVEIASGGRLGDLFAAAHPPHRSPFQGSVRSEALVAEVARAVRSALTSS